MRTDRSGVASRARPAPEDDFERYRATGDPEDLSRVFDALGPELLRLALHLVGTAADAEDLVQHTFLRAIERRRSWDASRPLRAWLARILENRAVDLHRRRLPDEKVDLEQLVDRRAPDDTLARAELSAELARAIDAVEEPYREALLLRLRHGLATADVAHVLGIAPGAARMRLSRGYEKLRRLIPPALAVAVTGAAFAGRGLAAVKSAVLEQARTTPAPPASEGPTATIAPAAGGLGLVAKLALAGGVLALALGTLLVVRGATTRGAAPGPLEPLSVARGEVAPAGARGDDGNGEARGRQPLVADGVTENTGGSETNATLSVVLRTNGAAAADVEVLVEPQGNGDLAPGLRRAVTGPDGTVRFDGLPAGRTTIRTARNERREVDLVGGDSGEVGFDLDRPLGVPVRTMDESGLPVENARIEVKDNEFGSWDWLGVAHTDERGQARVQVSEPPLTVRARLDGRRTSPYVRIGWTWDPDRPVDLVLGPRAPGLDLRVVDPDGSAVRDATFILDWREEDVGDRLADSPGQPIEAVDLKNCRMDRIGPLPGGETLITTPPAETFDVWASAPGYAPAKRAVDLAADAEGVVELRLEVGSTLRGRVVGDEGGLDVQLYHDELIFCPETVTDESGEFVLQDLPPGEAELWLTRPGQTQRLARREVRLLPGEDLTVEIEPPERRWVEGVVVDRALRPVADVWVLLTDPGARGSWGESALTSDEGRFQMPLFGVTPLELQVRAPHRTGAVLATLPVDAETPGPLRVEVDRERLPSAWLEVPRPRCPDGGSPYHWIQVKREGSPYSEPVTLAEDGDAHRVGPLVPGRYSIEVNAQGYLERQSLAVEVGPGETLRLDPPELVRGGYVRASCSEGGAMRVHFHDGEREVLVRVVEAGTSRILGALAPGTLRVEAFAWVDGQDRGEPRTASVEVVPGETTELVLAPPPPAGPGDS